MDASCRVILVCLLSATACASPQPKLSRDRVAAVERGVTTQEQIRTWFGEPTGLELAADGSSTWRYEYERSEVARAGRSRTALCTANRLPYLQSLLFWFRVCDEVRVVEEMVLSFTVNLVVDTFKFARIEFPEANRGIVLGPPIPGPVPGPFPVPLPTMPTASEEVAQADRSVLR
jgi:hypothetical protein